MAYKQRNLKIPSAAQVNKMLTTYRKENKKVFKEIMRLADAQGIKLKSKEKYYNGALPGKQTWISENKKNTKKVEKFWEQVTNKYGGSYSEYISRKRYWYEKYRDNIDNINDFRTSDNQIKPLTFENYQKFISSRDEIIDEIYKIAYQIRGEFGEDEVNFTDMRQELEDIFTLNDENLILTKLQEMKSDYEVRYNDLSNL